MGLVAVWMRLGKYERSQCSLVAAGVAHLMERFVEVFQVALLGIGSSMIPDEDKLVSTVRLRP